MAETAGYKTTVYKGGEAVATTNEPTTKVTANTVYQITDATKRVLDPTVTVTVEVDADGAGAGGYVAGTGYTVDYYTGTITFAADQGASALVRVSASYIPLLSVASARAAGIKRARTILDCTKFNSTGFRSYKYGRLEASGDLELVEDGFTDHDSGAGTQRFIDDIEDAVLVLLEIDMGGQGVKARCWATLETLDTNTPGDGLTTTKLSWKASGRGSAAVISTS
jgi:hypothetical protein